MCVSSLFCSFDKADLLSDAITCISIIFAFSQSAVLAIYGNKDINLYMKKNKMLKSYIKDNTFFMKLSILLLIILFLCKSYSFFVSFRCLLFLTSNHIAFIIIVVELFYTLDYIQRYMNVYNNSYTDKVLKQEKGIVNE